MKLLIISQLYPHAGEPRRGIFNVREYVEMARQGEPLVVLVPVPWCPPLLRLVKRWAKYDHTRPMLQFPGVTAIGVPYVAFPGAWFNRWSGLSVYLSLRRAVKRIKAHGPFDVIFCNDFFPTGDAATRLATELGLPVACRFIGVDLNQTVDLNAGIKAHFLKMVRRIDGLLCAGEQLAGKLKEMTGRSARSIYGVVDLSRFSPVSDKAPLRDRLGVPRAGVFGVFAGYLQERKGVFDLLDALSASRSRLTNFTMLMCGDGEHRERFLKRVEELGLASMVRWVGEVSPDEMSQWYGAADLFILPSHTEGMSNALMEAMACGLPAVVTAVGNTPNLLGSHPSVKIVPPRNLTALAEAVVTLASDATLRARMGREARALASEKFGVESRTREVLEYLRSLQRTTPAGAQGQGPIRRQSSV